MIPSSANEDYGPAQHALVLDNTAQTVTSPLRGGTQVASCPVAIRDRSEQLLLALATSTGGVVPIEIDRELPRPILRSGATPATHVP